MGTAQVASSAAKAAGKGSSTFLRLATKFSSVFILCAIVFAAAAIESFQSGDPTPLIKEVGGRLVLVTQDLQTKSSAIIADGPLLYSFEEGFWKGLWHVITTY